MRFNYTVRSIHPLSITLRATGFEAIEYITCYNISHRKSVCPFKADVTNYANTKRRTRTLSIYP